MSCYNVVFFCNREKDLPYLAVVVRSLAANCSARERLHIHILWIGLTCSDLERLSRSWADLSLRSTYHPIKDLVAGISADPRYGYWAYLWFEKVLPSDADRVLYLDCDVLVLGDVAELWKSDMQGYPLAAVVDPLAPFHTQNLCSIAPELGYQFEAGESYYNAGMLLIDLARWKRYEVLDRLQRSFHGGFAELRMHDQDTLNLIFRGNILSLSPKWNMLEYAQLYRDWPFGLYRDTEPPLEYFETRIRHFAGPIKPDTRWVRRSEKELFHRHLDCTDWSGRRTSAEQSWTARLLADVLELHYLVVRGLSQRVLRRPWNRIVAHLRVAPHSLLLYLGLPAYRLWLMLRRTD